MKIFFSGGDNKFNSSPKLPDWIWLPPILLIWGE